MRKHRFVADLSDLGRPQETGVVIVAGYAAPEENVTALLAAVEKTKKKHCGEQHIPVKWNLRGGGLDRALRRHKMEQKKETLVGRSKELRGDLLADMRTHGCKLFASAKHGYTGQGKTRHYLADFGFANILQRFGLFAKQEGGGRILLDWPSSSDSEHFVSEYLSAWRDGQVFTSAAANSPSRYVGITSSGQGTNGGGLTMWCFTTSSLTKPFAHQTVVDNSINLPPGGFGWYFSYTHFPTNIPATPRILGSSFDFWMDASEGIIIRNILKRVNCKLTGYTYWP